MTSSSPSQCFVYITLPGAVSAVTAGRFVLEETPKGDPLGRFVYGRSYLQNPAAVDIDPIELKLSEATYETMQLNGVFGALRDAGPDSWGRRIIEKHAGKAKLGELDYLLESPDDRAGALGFGMNRIPPTPRRKFNRARRSRKTPGDSRSPGQRRHSRRSRCPAGSGPVAPRNLHGRSTSESSDPG